MSVSYSRRSETPPPRVPSPEYLPQPLPVRKRRTDPAPLKFPPGLQALPPMLEKSRSMGEMRNAPSSSKRIVSERIPLAPKPITRSSLPHKSALKISSNVPPILDNIPSPTRSTISKRSSSRSLSLAIPYLSPPPSPTIATPPPPVPPIPAFVLSSTTSAEPVKLVPRRDATAPIELPDVISPISETLPAPWPKSKKRQLTLGKESKGLSCIGFFSLKNSKSRDAKPPLVART